MSEEKDAEFRPCVHDKDLLTRLKRIEGQVRGIAAMMESEKACEDILVQISAAKSALHKVGTRMLETHLRHCVVDGIRHGDPDKTVETFSKVIEQFSRLK